MEPITNLKITKIKDNKKFEIEDTLIREIKADIYLNDVKKISMMVTPIDLDALAIGYLISEGLINSINDINNIEIKETKIFIYANINQEKTQKLSEEAIIISGCGKSITANVDIDPENINAAKISSNKKISAKKIFEQMNEFYKSCPLYEKTGCVHTARFFIDENNFFDAEDIAQHATVDKAIGKALLKGFSGENGIMFVSGRLSSEMVVKAVMHKIPILISRTATTCLGAKIADFFNLTLIGFVRGDKMNIYTHPHRIVLNYN